MSEYWKSNPKKFCDFCKCWFADNRASIEFHERGKKHQENVRKKLEEIGKKGKEDYENKMKQDDYMKEMEEAALHAYKEDIEHNPDLMGAKVTEVANKSNAKIVIGKKEKEENKPKKKKEKDQKEKSKESKKIPLSKWREAKSPEGFSYYWNTETGESVWSPPSEGFIALEKPKKAPKMDSEVKSNSINTSNVDTQSVPSATKSYGPAPNMDPYGSWQNVQPSINDASEVDLQLPTLPEPEYYAPELVISKPEIKFKEKIVTLSSSGSSSTAVSFKKRKAGTADLHKKNVRKREDDK